MLTGTLALGFDSSPCHLVAMCSIVSTFWYRRKGTTDSGHILLSKAEFKSLCKLILTFAMLLPLPNGLALSLQRARQTAFSVSS